MLRVQRKIADGMDVLEFFAMNKWDFREDNYRGIRDILKGEDQKTWVGGKKKQYLIFNYYNYFRFTVDTENVDSSTYILNSVLGGRQYCLKEPLSTMPKARMQLKA